MMLNGSQYIIFVLDRSSFIVENRRMKKWILISVLLIVVVCSFVGFYLLSLPPKEKLSEEFKKEAITNLLGRKAQLEDKAVPTGDSRYSGRYLRFLYPAKALIYTYEDKDSKNSSDVEKFSFDIKSPRLIFNMENYPYSQNLDDYPAIRLREDRSYEYTKKEVNIDGVKGVEYFKEDQAAEKSGFFINSGRIFAFSVTGPNSDEVEKLFDKIIASVSFE